MPVLLSEFLKLSWLIYMKLWNILDLTVFFPTHFKSDIKRGSSNLIIIADDDNNKSNNNNNEYYKLVLL